VNLDAEKPEPITAAASSGEAAPGIERIDVAAVNAGARQSMYAKRKAIHPRRARGVFRRLKWVIMAVTLGIYYLTPWLRWDRGPSAPDQAVLIDLPGRRFYFFFIELWPQEVYYITGLLILAAIGLFLVTSVWGRAWCGYACPQTVWTDLFIAVERFIEGDRNARIRLDRATWTTGKLTKRALKHVSWIVIAVLTGGAWVFYFADAPTLFGQLFAGEAPMLAYIFIGLFTATTYLLGGLAREQVCIYMCPWPRIQAAMVDEDTLTVSYRRYRGEPRGSHKKSETWDGRGDCIDCNQCVVVCPMGIDIRHGAQLECITCALCIDACNEVMDKVGRPRGLIGYDTDANMIKRAAGGSPKIRLIRPRTIVYAVILLVVAGVMLYALANRSPLDLNVLRDRNPLYVALSDGGIRNGYTIKILNKARVETAFILDVEGLSDAEVAVIGGDAGGDATILTVPADQLGSFRVLVAAPAGAITEPSTPLRFVVTDPTNGVSAFVDSQFRGPE
jgi:cytochrome c oxidase accessory protein FixG